MAKLLTGVGLGVGGGGGGGWGVLIVVLFLGYKIKENLLTCLLFPFFIHSILHFISCFTSSIFTDLKI